MLLKIKDIELFSMIFIRKSSMPYSLWWNPPGCRTQFGDRKTLPGTGNCPGNRNSPPNWWSQPPAILKGWIDRVIRAGIAYKFVEGDQGEGVPVGLLNAIQAVVFNTFDTPRESEMKVFGDPLETLWKNCIFGLCGVEAFHRKNYGVMVTSTIEEREKWLEDVRTTVNSLF